MNDTLRRLLAMAVVLTGFIVCVWTTHELLPGYELFGFAAGAVWFACVLWFEFRRRFLEREGKRAPVMRTVACCGVMDRRENDYRERLMKEFRQNLRTHSVKPQAPLHTGTLVDGRFEHRGDEWYVTIKREVDNQERLRLQGEVEDIIRDVNSRKGSGDVWIIIVTGLFPSPSSNSTAQIKALSEYAADRAGAIAAERGRMREINIEVVPVEMAS
jgi:hypothetical protein